VTRPLAVHPELTQIGSGRRASHLNYHERGAMNQHWLEDLRYTVENFNSETGNRLEMLARLHDLDAARAAYDACRIKYPKKLLYLRQGGRILQRSDRPE
jgi:hypothetical protein